MRDWRVLGMSSLACALLALAPVRAQEAVDSGDVHRAFEHLTQLRSAPDLDDPARALDAAERLLDASDRVRACVRAHQPDVLESELEHVTDADDQRSMRAQLVLAQLKQLPKTWTARLARASDVTPRVYAALRERSFMVGMTRDAAVRPVEGRTLAALMSVAKDLRAQLSLDEQVLAEADPEFAADYRRECAPRLADPAKFVRESECSWLDLNGDREGELVVVCDSVWRTFWLHDFAFVAVIEPAKGNLRLWRLPTGGRVRATQVLDLDGDETPEVAVWIDLMGGRAPASMFLVISRHGVTSLSAHGPSQTLGIVTVDGRPLITADDGLDWSFPGGTATLRCGALATRYSVVRFEGGRFESVTSVWLPLVRGDE